MNISFIVANIDLFHFLVNPHITHALFVVYVIRLLYKRPLEGFIPICYFIQTQISFRFLYCEPHYCKTVTL
ncbi:hypothetical protein HanIR_Chr17g0889501 [Helianthus annuus]|nr:hypothetical protein HanIR_Chr17g0889501 [Helianthus annuus]